MTNLSPSFIAAAGEALQNACHGAAVESGWWHNLTTGDDMRQILRAPRNAAEQLLSAALFAQKLCLIHSEVSEAMEGDRKGLMDDKLPHRPMAEVELADVVIRVFDLAGGKGFDLAGAIVEKLAYNAQRSDHKLANRKAAGGKAY